MAQVRPPPPLSNQSSLQLTTPQKALKAQRTRNIAYLNRLHLTTLTAHLLFILLHYILFPSKPPPNSSRTNYFPYILYALLGLLPTLSLSLLFETIARPSKDGAKAGEDLDAPGLIEFGWDVLYWTFGVMGFVVLVGEGGWWLWGIGVGGYGGWVLLGLWRSWGGGGGSGLMPPQSVEGEGEGRRKGKGKGKAVRVG